MAHVRPQLIESAEEVVADIDRICNGQVIDRKPEYKALLQLLSQNLESVTDVFRNLPETQNDDLRGRLQNAESLIQDISGCVREVEGRAKSLFCKKSVTLQELAMYCQLVMGVENDLRSFIEMESEEQDQRQNTEIRQELQNMREGLENVRHGLGNVRVGLGNVQRVANANSSRLASHEADIRRLERDFQEAKIVKENEYRRVQSQFGEVEDQIKDLTESCQVLATVMGNGLRCYDSDTMSDYED